MQRLFPAEPDIVAGPDGGVESTMDIMDIAELEFPHASATLYVLVIFIGHVPVATSVLVTMSEASGEHASVTNTPSASRAATVVTGGGVEARLQPCTNDGNIPPAMTGAVRSATVIYCVAEDVLPHTSVAVHVLVYRFAPGHAPATVAFVNESVTAPPHASIAVAVAKFGDAGQLMVTGAGNEMTGL